MRKTTPRTTAIWLLTGDLQERILQSCEQFGLAGFVAEADTPMARVRLPVMAPRGATRAVATTATFIHVKFHPESWTVRQTPENSQTSSEARTITDNAGPRSIPDRAWSRDFRSLPRPSHSRLRAAAEIASTATICTNRSNEYHVILRLMLLAPTNPQLHTPMIFPIVAWSGIALSM